MKKKPYLLIFTLLLVLTSFCYIFYSKISQVYALNEDSFVTEITGLSFTPYAVDVDSNGWIFCIDETNNSVWRSQDLGETWNKVLQGGSIAGDNVMAIFVDSRDYVYARIKDASYWDLYRSTDGGDNWNVVIENEGQLWHFCEHANGTIYVNTYTTVGNDYVYRSIDGGATFTVWKDFNYLGADHIHSVHVDVANNEDVYVAFGDTTKNRVIRLVDGSWENMSGLEIGSPEASVGDFFSDGTYVYFLADGQDVSYRIPSRGSWMDKEAYWDSLGSGVSLEAVRIGDLMFFGTEGGMLWASADGVRWTKIFELGTSDSIFSISNRRPIYCVERANGHLFRVNVQKEDVQRLFYTTYVQNRGSKVNAENFLLEQRISNGTNHLDLTDVALNKVQISIKGLSRYNHLDNSGWETGDKTGWSETNPPLGVVKTGGPNGTYFYARNHSASVDVGLCDDVWTPTEVGDVHILSFLVKGNDTKTDAIRVSHYFEGGVLTNWQLIDVTTEWQRVYVAIIHDPNKSGTSFKWWLIFRTTAYPLETSIDSLIHSKLEVGISAGGSGSEAIQLLEAYKTPSYHSEILNTTNPSLIIMSQIVSHSGSLTNGTESSSTTLTGILTGVITVSANIQGSGQAILRLNGTRLLYEDSMILKGQIQTLSYGRYYDNWVPSASSSYQILVVPINGTINTISFDGHNLRFNLGAPIGSAISYIYCGSKGRPWRISGASSSYDSGSRILTLTTTHQSDEEVQVFWTQIPESLRSKFYSNFFLALQLLSMAPRAHEVYPQRVIRGETYIGVPTGFYMYGPPVQQRTWVQQQQYRQQEAYARQQLREMERLKEQMVFVPSGFYIYRVPREVGYYVPEIEWTQFQLRE